MNLLYLLPEYVNNAGGGIITFYRHFLPLLAAQGHEIHVLVGSGVYAEHAPKPAKVDGVTIEVLDHARLDRHKTRFARYAAMPGLRNALAAAWALWEQADGGDGFDLVEATDWGLLFLPWVIEKGLPQVVQLHGSMGQIDLHDPVRGEEVQGALIRLIERAGVGLAASAQAYSPANADFWRQQSGRPVKCIPPAWKPLLPIDTGAKRSSRGLVVGRVQRWKGPEVLCEALRLMCNPAPAIDWVGRDTILESREIKTSDHLHRSWPDIWGKSITHLPQQPFENTAQLQAGAAFMVVPSLWDTFNFTCVEAMGAGTPLVCSSGAGASDLIEDGVNGFVFENGKAESLAAALERLLSLSTVAHRTMADAAQQTVLRELDPDRISLHRLAAYEQCVQSGAGKKLPAEDWLRRACVPGDVGTSLSLDFLDHLPLRDLAKYSAMRVIRKIKR